MSISVCSKSSLGLTPSPLPRRHSLWTAPYCNVYFWSINLFWQASMTSEMPITKTYLLIYNFKNVIKTLVDILILALQLKKIFQASFCWNVLKVCMILANMQDGRLSANHFLTKYGKDEVKWKVLTKFLKVFEFEIIWKINRIPWLVTGFCNVTTPDFIAITT